MPGVDEYQYLTCPVCGERFQRKARAKKTAATGSIAQIEYCSEKCAKKVQNKKNYARRKARKDAEKKRPAWPASRHGATHGANWAHLVDADEEKK